MDIIEYKEEYRNELEAMVALIQDFERRINPEREEGSKLAGPWLDRYNPEKNNEKIFLGKFKGEIMSFIWVFIAPDELNRPEYKYLEVSDIFVKDYYRGKGFGKELLAFCERYAREKKVRGLFITALAKNRIALELYRNVGYQDLSVTLYKRL